MLSRNGSGRWLDTILACDIGTWPTNFIGDIWHWRWQWVVCSWLSLPLILGSSARTTPATGLITALSFSVGALVWISQWNLEWVVWHTLPQGCWPSQRVFDVRLQNISPRQEWAAKKVCNRPCQTRSFHRWFRNTRHHLIVWKMQLANDYICVGTSPGHVISIPWSNDGGFGVIRSTCFDLSVASIAWEDK